MGKSLGNAVFLKDLFKRYPPAVIRYFILTSHYRSPADFSDGALAAAQSGLERLYNTVSAVRERLDKAAPGEPADASLEEMLAKHKTRFLELMDDDFNTAGAIAELFDLSKDVNTLLNSGQALSHESLAEIDGLYRELGGQILGIIPDELAAKKGGVGLEEPLMQVLLETRAKLREAKQWALADAIRKQLTEIGVTIEDRPDGPVWKVEE